MSTDLRLIDGGAETRDPLKPCPFCGGTEVEYDDDQQSVVCQGCTACGPCADHNLVFGDASESDIETDVIGAWNHRVRPPPESPTAHDEVRVLRERLAAARASIISNAKACWKVGNETGHDAINGVLADFDRMNPDLVPPW